MVATIGVKGEAVDLTPVGLLTPTFKAHTWETKSVGVDGMLYGRRGGATTPNAVVRSGDSLDTIEIGFDFGGTTQTVNTEEGTEIGGALLWVTRTTAGYVAITEDHPADTGKLWFSTSFSSGWTVKQITRASNRIAIGRPVLGPNGQTWLFYGEYNAPTPKAYVLWASFDGGQTWSNIREMDIVNPAHQGHWHSVTYDPHMERIWAATGDGNNAWMGYSDDLGATWVDVPTSSRAVIADPAGTYQQPTILAVVGHRVFNCPDRGNLSTGVWEMDRRTGETTVVHETSPVAPYQQYGRGPYALDGPIAYFPYPRASGTTPFALVVTATGDGGRTWHNVYERGETGTESWTQGILGPDINGNLVIPGALAGVAGSLVAPELVWA